MSGVISERLSLRFENFQNSNFYYMNAIIHTDGGARGNPGPAAIGGVVKDADTGKEIEFSEYIGVATNNQAEYQSLLHAVRIAEKLKAQSVTCYLDSELIVKQLNREYRVKDPTLGDLYIKIWNIIKSFNTAKFIHVRREQNKHADRLVNRALDAYISLTRG